MSERNITTCPAGHFYDANIYATCPHCAELKGEKVNENKTTTWVKGDGGEKPDSALYKESMTARYEEDATTKPLEQGVDVMSGDDAKTMSILENPELSGTPRPTVGWLVCVKGRMQGIDFRLKSGCNFIGRDWDMDICLEGEKTVSRKRHAAIIYEPRQNIFIVKPGDSRELFYLKDEVVLEPKPMKKNDVIQVGNVSLMLIPCCDDKFTWPTTAEED